MSIKDFFKGVVCMVVFSCAGLAGAVVFGLVGVRPSSAEPFVSGDTVCWIGDSITHAGRYHTLVQLFYYTRYPDRVITYHNAGFGGDTAKNIMDAGTKNFRFNYDILSRKPTVATIMLGMNDLALKGFMDLEGTVEERERLAFSNYVNHMEPLIRELMEAGVRVILIQPSIYDGTAVIPNSPDTREGANERLGLGAEQILEWSKRYSTGLVDFYHSMNAINAGQQQGNPSFTIVGRDRIHPGPTGHFVMAYCFLRDTGVTPYVADVKIDAGNGAVISAVHCEITHVETSKDRMAFTYLAKALPFPVSTEYLSALDLVPFTDELNRERVMVSNLPEGVWSLEIDGQKCGEYSHADLSAGINLATNVNTPQYKQAVEIMKLNTRRQSLESELRGAKNFEYWHAKNGKEGLCPIENAEEVREWFEIRFLLLQSSAEPNVHTMRMYEINAYPEVKSALLSEIEEVVQEIRLEARPKERNIQLILQAN